MFRDEKENKNKFKNKKLEKCANLLDNKTEVSELKVSQIKKCGWSILPILEEIVKKIFFVFPPISLVSEACIISLPNLVIILDTEGVVCHM